MFKPIRQGFLLKSSSVVLIILLASAATASMPGLQLVGAQSVSYPLTQMSDSTASSSLPVFRGDQSQVEYISPTSQLIGKNIDQITVKLRKVGSPQGSFEVGIINSDLSTKKSFGIMNASSLSSTATDYTFSLLPGQTYVIQASDRIGIKYSSGDSNDYLGVTVDRNLADPFDGANSYRQQYTTAWSSITTDDMYMILKQSQQPDTTPPLVSASPTGGLYNSAQSVTLTASEPSTIYYTTDGTAPTTGSPVYSSPISIPSTTVLKFFAKDTAGNIGAVASQNYTIDKIPPVVTILPPAGLYNSSQNVALTANETGTIIYYTTNGSTPTTNSTQYASPFTVSMNTTVKFFGRDSAGNSETVQTASYQIDTVPPSVIASPPGGTYSSAQSVTLSASEPATIYYTTDGSAPSLNSSHGTSPLTGIAISSNGTETLHFFGVDTAGNFGAVTSATYSIANSTLNLSASPSGGLYNSTQYITLSSTDANSTIYYTTDGSMPTNSSSVYASPIVINQNTVLWFFGINSLGIKSGLSLQNYTIDIVPPTVSASPAGGLYNSTNTVTLAASEPSTIYYTTDGTAPTTSSAHGQSPVSGIAISSTTALRYYAVDIAGNIGVVNVQNYTIDTIPPTVAANPPPGLYNSTQTVALTPSEQATIYYTLDGSTPSKASPVYSSPISIPSTTVLKYFAIDAAGNNGTIQTASYVIDMVPPTVSASPAGGLYNSTKTVTLSASEPSTIYYTTNGLTPTTSSSVYSSPISISSNTTLRFMGIDTAGNRGTIVTQQYNIQIPSCSVSISPSGSVTKNVGEFAQFSAAVSGTGTPAYTWAISGNIIKDYQELTNYAAFATTGGYTGLTTTPMSPSDYNSQTIGFYWLPDPSQIYPNNANVSRTVSVSINNGLCSLTQTVTLIRSTHDPNRQPEDYYARLNHPLTYKVPMSGQQVTYNGTRLLQEHMLWHQTNTFTLSSGTGPQSYDGSLFFSYHKAMLDNYNAWRAMFGYPAIGTWTPGGRVSAIPTTENGQDATDSQRFGTGVIPTLPTYFMTSGGTTPRPAMNLCDRNMPAGQTKLSDFNNLTQLGCALTVNFHNLVHTTIGSFAVQGACTSPSIFTTQCGDMSIMMSSEKDPIFWMFHTFLDQIRQNYLAVTGASPHVLYQSPFPLYHYLTDFPSVKIQLHNGTLVDVPAIAVKFDQPVYGVRAQDLTVNGSPATMVSGSGAGPYIFTGFEYPSFGDVRVAISSGQVINVFDEPFAGDSWSFKRVDANGDLNHDGIADGIEVNTFLTNPEVSDTDGDGIPDSIEIQSHCLNPLDAHDADKISGLNGYTFLQEFRLFGIITCEAPAAQQPSQATFEAAVNRDPASP